MKKLRRQRKNREPKPEFIEIQYTKEPPILGQCVSCAHAALTPFVPQGTCPLQMEVATIHISCTQGHNCWQEGDCINFDQGIPEIQLTLFLAQN